jgi:hypothetical protein
MPVESLHDKAQRAGLAAMYEKHSGRDEFSDLFDPRSPQWAMTSIVEKVNDLRMFTMAGISIDELIAHYRAAHVVAPADRPAAALQTYEDAGYRIRPPTLGQAAITAAAADQPAMRHYNPDNAISPRPHTEVEAHENPTRR